MNFNKGRYGKINKKVSFKNFNWLSLQKKLDSVWKKTTFFK